MNRIVITVGNRNILLSTGVGLIKTLKKKINKLGHCHPDRIILDLYLISWSPLLWQFC